MCAEELSVLVDLFINGVVLWDFPLRETVGGRHFFFFFWSFKEYEHCENWHHVDGESAGSECYL